MVTFNLMQPNSASTDASHWQIRTRPNRHFPFLSRHPWVLASTLAHDTLRPILRNDASDQAPQASANDSAQPTAPQPKCGDVVDLLDHDGNWIARGLINPESRLRIRLYVFAKELAIDSQLWSSRIDQAVARRRLMGTANPEGGERLIFSESDLLSGLIVDRYADCLSVQFTGAVLLPFAKHLVQEVQSAAAKHGTPCTKVLVRMDEATVKHEKVSEDDLRQLESLTSIEETDSTVWYQHNGLEMAIDLQDGQKTGGYLDQQNNHAAAAAYMKGRRVLDICTYTGGFALAAARAGASEVVAVDSSERALAIAQRNAERNQLTNVRFEQGDCFHDLKERHQRGEQFDAIILDPPRFAGSRKQTEAALRAYTRLNASAVDLLPPGGMLVTCSCSGRVSRSDFLNMLVDVGRKRRRDLVVLESRGPSPDHVFAISCPESDYLKCIVVQVM
ncbi:class I SAM-dependent rRNA methyltransferase [Rhodopirellula halodulae]|uniref:class I SAM-dependent rRNA methyltransferase n=1 Tax=Rhodopirellula halodulae TaxID=2894198 RepID=UPI001E405CAA|nr:class I SAM-dependent methyltransferase [Rhodopirellula sp. JC737]MCC9657865.1 class I SAM-dependent methyltransferase [Rhodopirellula sp. JC737]